MVNLVEEVEARAKKEAPVKTSNLVNSITSSVSSDGLKGEVTVGARYAEYVHRGTGLFGPFKQKIFPKTKKALFWPGAAHPVKWVKGMKPNPFFDRALKWIKPQKTFEDGVLGYLKQQGVG
jgi:HK97 gp10 family phage protein